jgi:hypothetical protein
MPKSLQITKSNGRFRQDYSESGYHQTKDPPPTRSRSATLMLNVANETIQIIVSRANIQKKRLRG